MSDLNMPGVEDGVQSDDPQRDEDLEAQSTIGEHVGDMSFGIGRTPPPPG